MLAHCGGGFGGRILAMKFFLNVQGSRLAGELERAKRRQLQRRRFASGGRPDSSSKIGAVATTAPVSSRPGSWTAGNAQGFGC